MLKGKYEIYKCKEMMQWEGFTISKMTYDLIVNLDSKNHSMEDLAYGCIIGGMIGDTCGSYIEFIEHQPSEQEIEDCLKFLGGGPHGVGKG